MYSTNKYPGSVINKFQISGISQEKETFDSCVRSMFLNVSDTLETSDYLLLGAAVARGRLIPQVKPNISISLAMG